MERLHHCEKVTSYEAASTGAVDATNVAAPMINSAYGWYTKCARRFCCQHDSVLSVQNGFSLP